jgi:AcrR family transcriptional regulator
VGAQRLSTEIGVRARPNRRDTIIDAAEGLFAERGVDAVSVRNIADAAGVKLSLVTYHFPSKDQLFAEVLVRRSGALTTARLDRLRARRGADGFDLTKLIDCFIRPLLEMALKDDTGWRNYVHLIVQIAQSHKYSTRAAALYDENSKVFIEALLELFPNASRENAIRAWVYLVSVMLGAFSSTGRVETLSNGQLSADPDVAYESMCKFIVAGMHSLMQE